MKNSFKIGDLVKSSRANGTVAYHVEATKLDILQLDLIRFISGIVIWVNHDEETFQDKYVVVLTNNLDLIRVYDATINLQLLSET